LPGAIATLTGNQSICVGATGEDYVSGTSVGATSYFWTVPAGVSIVSGQGTTTLKVDYETSFVSGNITVQGENALGRGPARSIAVSLAVQPSITPTDADVCANLPTVYTTPDNSNDYTWEMLNGGTINSGGDTNQATITWNTIGVGKVAVHENNGTCTNSDTLSVNIISCNNNPVLLGIGNQEACGNNDLGVVTIQATDIDGDDLIFSFVGGTPAGLVLSAPVRVNATTMQVEMSWSNIANPGVASQNHSITVKVEDGNLGENSETFTITVHRQPVTGSSYTVPN